MKKYKTYTGLMILVLVFALSVRYACIPEYETYKILSQEDVGFKEMELHIVVYKPWNVDGTVRWITTQYNKMDKMPNGLAALLYHSKYDVDHSRDYYKAVYENQGEYDLPPLYLLQRNLKLVDLTRPHITCPMRPPGYGQL